MAKKTAVTDEPLAAWAKMPAGAFRFLDGLAENNERAWFQANQDAYKNQTRLPFIAFLDALSDSPEAQALPVFGGSHTMFRINRDVRFAKDKTPYNTHLSAILTPTGEKDESGGIVYVQMGLDGGLAAAGFYMLPTPRLNELRRRIVDRPGDFTKALQKLKRAKLELDPGEPLKRMPRGFEEHADHAHADWLRAKSLVTSVRLTRRD
ncbi:MAG: DUF2461 domain-containing protein [Planctomycetota bacterium]